MITLESIEYPDSDAMLGGVPLGALFEYVGSAYLDGFINLIQIRAAWLLVRYAADGHDDAVRRIESDVHPRLMRHDDCIVVGTSHGGAQSWVFWYDQDTSDCCIGRGRFEASDMLGYARYMTKDYKHVYIDAEALQHGWKSGGL